jgi:hypothetical protein
MEDPNTQQGDRIRAAEAILNRGLGKVAELLEEKKQTFAFFQAVTPAETPFVVPTSSREAPEEIRDRGTKSTSAACESERVFTSARSEPQPRSTTAAQARGILCSYRPALKSRHAQGQARPQTITPPSQVVVVPVPLLH